MLQQRIQLGLLHIKNHQPRTGLGEAQHQRPADASTTAGNQHDLAVINLVGKHFAMHNPAPITT